jgi:hypothetical protein
MLRRARQAFLRLNFGDRRFLLPFRQVDMLFAYARPF